MRYLMHFQTVACMTLAAALFITTSCKDGQATSRVREVAKSVTAGDFCQVEKITTVDREFDPAKSSFMNAWVRWIVHRLVGIVIRIVHDTACLVSFDALTLHQRVVRSWFFAKDGGFYVQCKYGAKALALSKDGNAVFVKQLSDVPAALQAIYAATAAGELDAAITSCIKR